MTCETCTYWKQSTQPGYEGMGDCVNSKFIQKHSPDFEKVATFDTTIACEYYIQKLEIKDYSHNKSIIEANPNIYGIMYVRDYCLLSDEIPKVSFMFGFVEGNPDLDFNTDVITTDGLEIPSFRIRKYIINKDGIIENINNEKCNIALCTATESWDCIEIKEKN